MVRVCKCEPFIYVRFTTKILKKPQSASVGKKFSQHASRTQNDIYIHSVTRIRPKKPQHAE